MIAENTPMNIVFGKNVVNRSNESNQASYFGSVLFFRNTKNQTKPKRWRCHQFKHFFYRKMVQTEPITPLLIDASHFPDFLAQFRHVLSFVSLLS